MVRPGLVGLLLSACLATNACSGAEQGADADTGPAAASTTADAKDATKLEATWNDFRAVADRLPAQRLELPHLTSTASFTAKQVRILAALAQQITLRSIDPKLTSMTRDEAVNYVLKPTDFDTSSAVYREFATFRDDNDWSYELASQFPANAELGRPEIIDARWKWGQNTGTDSQGISRPHLWLALQTFTRTPVTVDGQTYPIVVRRTVTEGSYRPDGGPGWWPDVRFYTYPYGNDACYLSSRRYPGEDRAVGPGPRLVPNRRLGELRQDLSDLSEWLSPKALAPGSKSKDSISYPNYDAAAKAKQKLTLKQVKKNAAYKRSRCSTQGL